MDNHANIIDVPNTMSSALETSPHNNLRRTITITITITIITITTVVTIIIPTKVQKVKLPKAMPLSVA